MSLAAIARAVGDAAAYLCGMPSAPVPLERTDRAPWVWASAQALRSRVPPAALAAALRADDRVEAVATRADGLLELTLAPAAVCAALLELASGDGMPPAHLPVRPAGPGVDAFWLAVTRFEAARTAAGASRLAPRVAARRTLDNPVTVVPLAQARASRVARQAAALTGASDFWTAAVASTPAAALSTSATPALLIDPVAVQALDDPLDLALLTELLDAPRRLARHQSHPQEVATALLAVATAYLAWEERCPAIPTRPGEATSSRHLARQFVSLAGSSVLERGMAVLGVSAPERM